MKQCIKTNGVLFFFCLISLIITAQEQSVQSNIKCLNYPSSFELLLRHFKGKIVYIDVMASWCKPCLAELKEYEKTDDFFSLKNAILNVVFNTDLKQKIKANAVKIRETNSKERILPIWIEYINTILQKKE